jgi:hypothetical protein
MAKGKGKEPSKSGPKTTTPRQRTTSAGSSSGNASNSRARSAPPTTGGPASSSQTSSQASRASNIAGNATNASANGGGTPTLDLTEYLDEEPMGLAAPMRGGTSSSTRNPPSNVVRGIGQTNTPGNPPSRASSGSSRGSSSSQTSAAGAARSEQPMSNPIPIPNFDPDDYSGWSFDMECYLLAAECWGAIDNNSNQWGQLSDGVKETRRARAFNFIRHSLGRAYHYVAQEHTPSRPDLLWTRLRNMFLRTDSMT